MADVKVELNLPGLNQLMKSDGIKKALERAGDAVANQAANLSGETYKRRKTRKLNWLAAVNVTPTNEAATNDELENNTLLKSIRSVGLSTRKGGSN